MKLPGFVSLLLTAATVIHAQKKCKPVYVRWTRAALDKTSRVSGNYAIEDCQKACSGQYHPANERYKFACTAFNFRQSPAAAQDRECELFREDQLRSIDHDVVAREDFTFYRQYCVQTKKTCKALYHYDLIVDSYMDQSEVERRLPALGVEDCLALCLEEAAFTCRSVSFNRTGSECMLSAHSRVSKPGRVKLNNNPNWRVDYYENNCYNDSFSFSHKCDEKGITVSVASKYPYTGALYGLYDFFSCRTEPKAATAFGHYFPFPDWASNCTGSMTSKNGKITLDVVLSADGVQPLYFLTDQDMMYQAVCNDPKAAKTSSTTARQTTPTTTTKPAKPTSIGLRIDGTDKGETKGGGDIPWWKQTAPSRKETTRTTTSRPITTTTTREPITARRTKWWEKVSVNPRTTDRLTTTTTAKPTRVTPWWWQRTLETDAPSPSTTRTTRRQTTRRPLKTTTERSTPRVTTPTTRRPTTTSTSTTTTTTTPKPTTTTTPEPTEPPQPVKFEIKSNDIAASAVLVNSPITLRFMSSVAGRFKANQISLMSCKVEPTRSRFAYGPVHLINDGCSADGVGLVEPIQQTADGLSVKMGPLRYTDSAETMYTCTVRVCKVQCPSFSCINADGRPYISYGRRRRRQIANVRPEPNFRPKLEPQARGLPDFRNLGLTNSGSGNPSLRGLDALESRLASLGRNLPIPSGSGGVQLRHNPLAPNSNPLLTAAQAVNSRPSLLRPSTGLSPQVNGLGSSNQWANVDYQEIQLTKKLVVLNSQYALNYYLKTGLILPEEEQQFAPAG